MHGVWPPLPQEGCRVLITTFVMSMRQKAITVMSSNRASSSPEASPSNSVVMAQSHHLNMGLTDTHVLVHRVQQDHFILPVRGSIRFVIQSNSRIMEEDVKGGMFTLASSGADKNTMVSFKSLCQPDQYCGCREKQLFPGTEPSSP